MPLISTPFCDNSSSFTGSPRCLQQSLDILATRVPCNYVLFFFPLFSSSSSLWHACLFSSASASQCRCRRRPSPSSFHPSSLLFVFLVPFLYHFIIICRCNQWKIDATPRCQSSAISMLKARSQRLCAAVATCIFIPLIGVCTSRHFCLTVVNNCGKIYHLNKSFYGRPAFFSSSGLLSLNGRNFLIN